MNKTKRTAKSPLTKTVSSCDQMPLQADTPCGLFEAENRSRYIVTAMDCHKIAIALVHENLPPFTWQGLTSLPIDYGWWLGPYSLRLLRSTPIKGPVSAGTIGMMGNVAILDCESLEGEISGIVLGKAEGGSSHRDFKHWSIAAAGSKLTFFERCSPARVRMDLAITNPPGS